jgi:hypothetical protein
MLSDPSLILTVVLVKLPFYAMAGAFLRGKAKGAGLSLIPSGWRGPLAFGLVRCLLGVAASLVAFELLTGPETGAPLLWPVQVGPVRILAWALTLLMLFPGCHNRRMWTVGWSLVGTAYSYLLDVLAITVAFSLGTLTLTDVFTRVP